MTIQDICTSEELRHFADNSKLTINELSKFIEVKTNKQYVIVQKEFVKAISNQLFNNTLHIFEINKFLNEIWAKIVSTNQTTTDKWKEHLKVFEDQTSSKHSYIRFKETLTFALAIITQSFQLLQLLQFIMPLNVDSIIFISFLIINLLLGLISSRKITTLKEYAIGDGSFNTHLLTNTIVATYIGGGFFMFNIVENYQHGLYFAFTSIAELFTFLIIGWYFAPRLSQFLGKMSIAEAMGSLYKEKVQLITAICGFIGVVGFLVLQLKVAGVVFEYVFNLKPFYGVLLAGIIVTIYSAVGGIKSVTFTDMVQLFTFGTIIPIVSYYFYTSVDGFDVVLNTVLTNSNFDLGKIFDTSNLKFWNYLSISIIFLIPNFDPAIFQRIAMCKNVYQIRKSFYTVFFICLFLLVTMFWLCLLILTKTPNLSPDDIIKIGVFNALPLGMKGLLLVGVFAIVMSTADSYINSSAVLITYDFCKVLKIKLKNKLLSARIISFLLGLLAIFLSFKETNILKFSIFCISFYTPIVVVPFIMATCGYKTPYEKAVLWGMGAAFITVLSWNYCGITIIDSIVPAMLVNLVTIVFMHYYYHSRHLKLQNKQLY